MDLRFFYSFLIQVKEELPFSDIEEEVTDLIKDLAEKGIVKRACLIPHDDVVDLIVIGGSPKLWKRCGVQVKELESVVADQLIDMFCFCEHAYIYSVDD